jgi:YesN/AraC family two-component response regulator
MLKLLRENRYFVKTAADGIEAMNILKDTKIDLIITDVRMPNMNGIELCKVIKSMDNLAHIPVLMLTINKSKESQESGYISGADGFLTKPFNPDILLVRVNNLIRNRNIIRTRYNDEKLLNPKGKELTNKESVFIDKAIALVEKNLDNPGFDKAAFCREMGISPAHMYRRIRKLMNQSVNEFIRTIRLNKAAQILQCGKNINITELAYTVGFSDQYYFTRTFRERFGLTPSQYNNKYLSSF